ncbi:UDP-glucose dehydrogenase family protein [Ideonella sp. YS5]|uniref:UDP-glucose dehydrogenase family protein n=1 Tax=Ideonella sp. YS5 TaxID=3453714 RepID=UPI003EEA0E24
MKNDDHAAGGGSSDAAATSISVFGAGYVGLVTAACLAGLGHAVVCMDTDAERVEQLAAVASGGPLPFHEPGLAELMAGLYRDGRLRFTADAGEAVAHGRLLFIAVGTPGTDDGSADLRHVLSVARAIGEGITREVLVVNKSTVPVGTAERVREVIGASLARRGRADLDFAVVSNPEFLREGSAVHDFMHPDRIVAGADRPAVLAELQRLYAPLLRDPVRQWLPMSVRSAEMCKYASNVMLAARISLMNDLALLAETLDTDIEEVRRGMAGDPRIGAGFLAAGCGFGGSCLPKDLRALLHTAADAGLELPMLEATEEVNERQKLLLARHVAQAFDGHLEGRRIALWGLAFKPGTDDLREAPSEVLIRALLAEGAEVVAHDPMAMPAARLRHALWSGLRFAADPLGAVAGADALVIATEWPQYRDIDWARVRRCMAGDWVFDGRNVCDGALLAARGFNYRGIGRRTHEGAAAAMAVAR